jgi:hypothetical protein
VKKGEKRKVDKKPNNKKGEKTIKNLKHKKGKNGNKRGGTEDQCSDT